MTLRIDHPRAASPDRPPSIPPRITVARRVELRTLEWDTAFFGAKMGSIVSLSGPESVPPARRAEGLGTDLRALLSQARSEGYAHLIFRAPAEDLPSAWAAAWAGLRLVDVGVDSTFSFHASTALSPSSADSIRPARPGDVASLRDLAASAFVLSRFSTDPFFSPEQVAAFHREWVSNLCAGLAQAVLVSEIEGKAIGFVACAMDGSEGRIPLIATSAGHRGRGVGRGLIGAALRWFSAAGARVVHVKTQVTNYPALALYHRAGFVVSKSEFTFSITLGPSGLQDWEADHG